MFIYDSEEASCAYSIRPAFLVAFGRRTDLLRMALVRLELVAHIVPALVDVVNRAIDAVDGVDCDEGGVDAVVGIKNGIYVGACKCFAENL